MTVSTAKTGAFVDDNPIVGFAPWFARKPVLFISYSLPEKESDEESVQASTKTEGPFTELYTFERGKLVRKHFLVEGSAYLSPGYEKSSTTKLSFAEGKKSKGLFVILETTTKLKTYNTGGGDEENLRWHCSNHTVLFALTPKGTKWKKYAGRALKRLRKGEPALKLLLDDHKKTQKEECD